MNLERSGGGAGNELLTRGPAPRLDQAIRLPPIV
jgi:hypothetical protein